LRSARLGPNERLSDLLRDVFGQARMELAFAGGQQPALHLGGGTRTGLGLAFDAAAPAEGIASTVAAPTAHPTVTRKSRRVFIESSLLQGNCARTDSYVPSPMWGRDFSSSHFSSWRPGSFQYVIVCPARWRTTPV